MDIKDLLNLAKDNQSYHQKKFQHDQLLKNKKKSDIDVSGSAVKAFLAKKQEAEKRAKAAEDAARRKRIEERLQASQGKVKSANSKTPQTADELRKGISEKRNPKYEELRRQNLKHVQKTTKEKEHRVSKVERQEHRGSKVEKQEHRVSKVERKEHRVSKVEKPSDKMRGSHRSNAKKTSSKIDFKELMKVAKGQADQKPELPVKKEYKQHRRKGGKEGDFEWSGARSTIESKQGDSISRKAEKEYLSKAERSKEMERTAKGKLKTAKKAASTVNFKDLLNVAKQQANKPTSVAQKKDVAIRKEAEGSKHDIAKRRDGGFGKHGSKRPPEPQRKHRYVDINDVRVNNKIEHSSQRPAKQMGLPKSGGCKLVTRTIDNKRNYEMEGPRMSQQRNGGQGSYGNHNVSNRMKRSKVDSIDDELEQERRELEKRRNMLKRKMQGLPQDEVSDFSEYSEDDYDEEDDMADFIDDGGEDTDYSKHIRSIFGYDRRKFRGDEDDDLSTMEASYSQIAAEESRSARIAKLEDEIERRREEMDLHKAKKRR